MHFPVKICGITSINDAKTSINYGASAIGFIFYKKSPRYICSERLVKWIQKIPANIKKVGVFVNEDKDVVSSIVGKLGLDFIQLHGDESSAYCSEMILPVIKVFRIDSVFDAKILNEYKVKAFLFDTYKDGTLGGTGKVFKWDLVASLKTEIAIILSGGLNIDNILEGINMVSPYAIDINSGVEISPGKKDEEKVRNIFVKLENNFAKMRGDNEKNVLFESNN